MDGNNRWSKIKKVNKYDAYKKLTNDKMTFIGRCGMYVYIDMHQAINSALSTAKKFLEKKESIRTL